MSKIISLFTIIQFFACNDIGNSTNISKEHDLRLEIFNSIQVYDGGGLDAAPLLLLDIDSLGIKKYKYGINSTVEDSFLLKLPAEFTSMVPAEFIITSGGDFSSPTDDEGFIYIINLKNGKKNRWGVFNSNFKYSESIIRFNKIIDSLCKQ